MYKRIVFVFLAIGFLSCLHENSEDTDSWNLLGGPYEKTGEMIVWRGYWVEAYRDTITNLHKVLFVKKDNKKFISDSLNVGLLDSSETLDYGTVELNEQEDREIVVIVKTDDSLYHTNIVRAWRANTKTGKFQSCSIDGIRAKNAEKFYSH
jgi:hypothetical protein